ncbi:hypothetical protein TrLO_g1270 [Triparma laevis f. longispina]|uniref:PX domain-containing protein n=1 Tax=Triparma laevis f. longispina TaxID=1714387 RepID=A0A9W7FC71_9STRA|nr:hypothetical protein TrLO_g1270 [Triparma laevis f. longispina]
MPPRWGHHHRHHHHGPPLGAMMVGAALGAGVMAASRPPPPRTVYVQQPQTTTVVYANNGDYGGATQTTYVQAPPLQAYNQQQVTGISVQSFELRTRDTVYYKVLITSADCPSPGWYVWRRYNQFNELRETVEKYIQLYAPFPQKSSAFNAIMGVKPNAQELESRRQLLDSWLRELVQKASNSSRAHLHNVLKVFLEYRSRQSHQQRYQTELNGYNISGVIGQGSANQGGNVSTMQTTAMSGGGISQQQMQQQQFQQQPMMAEAEVVVNSVPVFEPSQGNNVRSEPLSNPTGDASAPVFQHSGSSGLTNSEVNEKDNSQV